MFYNYYKNVLDYVKYPTTHDLIDKLAYNITYDDDKYKYYDDVVDNLKRLNEKYTLILLTDNWPCVIRILKNKGIYDLFKKIYISSIYGHQKSDRKLFEYPILDFNIKENEALFIDDNEKILDIAVTYGYQAKLMDRDKKAYKSKYIIINNLNDIK